MSRPILLATRSAGKLNEMHKIFKDLGVEVTDLLTLGIAEAPEEHLLEEFPTFEENALAKARYFFKKSGGIPTIGDDSGLTIDALAGAPGVLTKRWSGRADISGAELDRVNNEKLVREMRRLEAEKGNVSRAAQYVSVAAYVDGKIEIVRRGEVAGEVLDAPRGSLGFGYDPFFLAPELGGTYAESSIENTARHSHRRKAMEAVIAALRAGGRIR
jgi:XTP/dITP diphosphohydrolase